MLITGVLALLAALSLGLVRQQPWTLDTTWQHDAQSWLAGEDALLRLLVLPSESVVLLPTVTLIAAVCLLQRESSAAALAVIAPALAVALNSLALKPLFRALSDGPLDYPSGHTASLAAVCTVLILQARPGIGRWVTVALSVLVIAAAGVGMVTLDHHYPFDIVGGVGIGLGVVALGEVTRRRLAPTPSTG